VLSVDSSAEVAVSPKGHAVSAPQTLTALPPAHLLGRVEKHTSLEVHELRGIAQRCEVASAAVDLASAEVPNELPANRSKEAGVYGLTDSMPKGLACNSHDAFSGAYCADPFSCGLLAGVPSVPLNRPLPHFPTAASLAPLAHRESLVALSYTESAQDLAVPFTGPVDRHTIGGMGVVRRAAPNVSRGLHQSAPAVVPDLAGQDDSAGRAQAAVVSFDFDDRPSSPAAGTAGVSLPSSPIVPKEQRAINLKERVSHVANSSLGDSEIERLRPLLQLPYTVGTSPQKATPGVISPECGRRLPVIGEISDDEAALDHMQLDELSIEQNPERVPMSRAPSEDRGEHNSVGAIPGLQQEVECRRSLKLVWSPIKLVPRSIRSML
jgi:hypothetical protein